MTTILNAKAKPTSDNTPVTQRSKAVDRVAKATGIASLAAGATFILALFAILFLTEPPNQPVRVIDIVQALFFTPVLCLIATPFGFALALLPNLIGTAVMTIVSRFVPPARHPAAWGIVGATVILIPGYRNIVPYQGVAFILAMAITGCICALICRRIMSPTLQGWARATA